MVYEQYGFETLITCISHGPSSWQKYQPKIEFLNFTVFTVDVGLSQMAENPKKIRVVLKA